MADNIVAEQVNGRPRPKFLASIPSSISSVLVAWNVASAVAAAGRQDAARDTRANEKAILASLREEGKKLQAIDTKKFEDFRKTLKEGVGEAEAYSIRGALEKNKELDCMDSSTQQLRADAEQKFKDYH